MIIPEDVSEVEKVTEKYSEAEKGTGAAAGDKKTGKLETDSAGGFCNLCILS